MDHWEVGCGLHPTVQKYGPAVGCWRCGDDTDFQKIENFNVFKM